MRRARLTIGRLMIAVAVVAVDCVLLPYVFDGVLVLVIALHVALFRLGREHPRRRSWTGFLAGGLALIGMYIASGGALLEWSGRALVETVKCVPPVARAFERFVNSHPASGWIVFAELAYGMPALASAVLTGLLATAWRSGRLSPAADTGRV
jgi:hypothetical protein